MIKGQCLCGTVQYRYHAEITQSILCYCQHCQQAQGSIAGWNSLINQTHFELLMGQNHLKEYFHTPNKSRVSTLLFTLPIFSSLK